jgi:Acetyltransferase (GNAT) domain
MTNRTQYQQFCTSEPDLPIFMQWWYLDATCGDTGWESAIVEQSGRVVGIWPYFVKKTWGISRVTMPPFLRQCGPWVSENTDDPEDYNDILADLARQLPKTSAFSQDLPFQPSERLPMRWRGYQLSERTTYTLNDVHKQDETYYQIKSDYRKNKLPKAEKHYNLDTEVPIETFLKLHTATYLRQKMELPADDAYIRQLDTALEKHGARRIIGARHKESGEVHAVAYLIADAHTCYLLASADVVEYRSNAPSIFVLYHGILQAHAHFQVQKFDFLGSMVKKIASVRKQFGAKPKTYLRMERYSWWLQWRRKI